MFARDKISWRKRIDTHVMTEIRIEWIGDS